MRVTDLNISQKHTIIILSPANYNPPQFGPCLYTKLKGLSTRYCDRWSERRRRKTRNLVEDFLLLQGEDLIHTLQPDAEEICGLLQGFLLPAQLLQRPGRTDIMEVNTVLHFNAIHLQHVDRLR